MIGLSGSAVFRRRAQARLGPRAPPRRRLHPVRGVLDASFATGGIASSTSLGAITNLVVDGSGDVFVLPAHWPKFLV
jgi:hypothetical protein